MHQEVWCLWAMACRRGAHCQVINGLFRVVAIILLHPSRPNCDVHIVLNIRWFCCCCCLFIFNLFSSISGLFLVWWHKGILICNATESSITFQCSHTCIPHRDGPLKVCVCGGGYPAIYFSLNLNIR